MKTTAHTISR